MGTLRKLALPAVVRKAAPAVAFVGASLATVPVARAELTLRWEAPPHCPQRDDVFRRVAALAGSAPAESAGLGIEGSIAPEKGRYRLTLLVRSGGELRKRVIVSDSCEDLAGAAAVAVALLLGLDPSSLGEDPGDPSVAEANRAGTSPSGTTPEPGPGDDRAQRPDAERPEDPKDDDESRTPPAGDGDAARDWSFVLRAPVLAFDVGPLPQPTLGLGIGAGLRFESWYLLATARAYRKESVDAADAGGAFGAELVRLSADLTLCRGFRSAAFELAPCLAAAVEHLKAQGYGDGITPASRRTTWAAVGAGGTVRWFALESLALFLGATGYVELARPRVVVENLGEITQLAPVALGTAFGVEWIL